jgi:hypothetical protein
MMTILYQAAKNPQDPILQNPLKVLLLAQRISQARSLGMAFQDLNSFIQFVQDPDGALGMTTAGQQSTSGGNTPAAGTNALGLPTVDGLQLDAGKLGQIAKAGPRRVYRVVAAAQVGRVEKRLIGVWDTETHNQNMTDPAYARGTWVYWRDE